MPFASYLNSISDAQAISELAKMGITFPQKKDNP